MILPYTQILGYLGCKFIRAYDVTYSPNLELFFIFASMLMIRANLRRRWLCRFDKTSLLIVFRCRWQFFLNICWLSYMLWRASLFGIGIMMLVICIVSAGNFWVISSCCRPKGPVVIATLLEPKVYFLVLSAEAPEWIDGTMRTIDSVALGTLCLMYRRGPFLVCIVFIICSARIFPEALTKTMCILSYFFKGP